MSQLNLDPLRKAHEALGRALQQKKDEYLRDAVIQRFKFCFELSWKFLKRYFEWNQKLFESNIKNTIREAGKQGLIESVEKWFAYLEARNKTSHAYDEALAEEIYKHAAGFHKDCGVLIDKLFNLIR